MRPCLTIAVVSVGMRRSPGRRYLSFVLLALLAELVNLFEVVLAVDPMKFSPLTRRSGVRGWDGRALGCACQSGLRIAQSGRPWLRSAARCRVRLLPPPCREARACFGDFRPSGKCPSPVTTNVLTRSFSIGVRASGFARLQATLEILRGSGVGEIEVLENFGGAPLALGMTPQVFGAHVSGGRRDRFL